MNRRSVPFSSETWFRSFTVTSFVSVRVRRVISSHMRWPISLRYSKKSTTTSSGFASIIATVFVSPARMTYSGAPSFVRPW